MFAPEVGDGRLAVPVTDNDHIRGNSNAPVTIVEYADYQCPYCRESFFTLRQLESDQRVRVVFRNFPLRQMHPYAEHAAQAAEIAGEFGKFWQMHDTIFRNQAQITDEDLQQYAAELGIDGDKFAKQLAAGAEARRVHQDFEGGVRSGVQGTPTLFINGERYRGTLDPDGLARAVGRYS